MRTHVKSQHRCADCGYAASKWFGRCPDCGSWSTAAQDEPGGAEQVQVVTLAAACGRAAERLTTGIAEFDRVVGGGLVPGSVVLLSGEPGIGKSTLVLQVVDALVREGRTSLLATGEESLDQVALRADRLRLPASSMRAIATGSIADVERAANVERPDVLIVDSIQTIEDDVLEQAPGTPVQVRECASRLVRLAKTTNMTVLAVGHVTKDGGVAGPKTLEHVVDAVLSLDGDRSGTLRLLRAAKNRFGSCEETGVFVMSDSGLDGVPDPSDLLIGDRRPGIPGSVVFPAMHGSRPVLIEIQALVVEGSKLARRVAIGIEPRRLALVLGLLAKRMRVDLSECDVFVAAAGGAVTNEPAADLPIALAVTSARWNQPLPDDAAALGELGLAGELRSARALERRLNEAARLGLKTIFVPHQEVGGANAVRVEDLNAAITRALPRAVRPASVA